MSKPLKPRRGTTAEQNAFVGEAYEITYDTDKNTLVCRDGVTPGGFPLARADEVAAKDAEQDEAIAGKLGKSGGTMTGTLISSADITITKQTNDSRLLFQSAPDWTEGAWMHLGAKNSPYDGEFQISSRLLNGQAGSLIGKGNSLTWSGSTVLTSAGGDISGPLKSAPGGTYAITSQVTNSLIRILGGTSPGTGANLDLYGGDSEEKGMFILRARDLNGFKALMGSISGELTWGDKNIVRSVNGVAADAAGNVPLFELINNADNGYVSLGGSLILAWSHIYKIQAGKLNTITKPTSFTTLTLLVSDVVWSATSYDSGQKDLNLAWYKAMSTSTTDTVGGVNSMSAVTVFWLGYK